MSRFPTTPLPSDGPPLQLPYLPTAQQQAPGPSTWSQFSEALQSLGGLVAKTIDVQAEMTTAEARQLAMQQDEEAQRLRAEQVRRQEIAKVELAQLRLDYAGNPEGLSNAMAGFLQKHSDDPAILDDGLNAWRSAREEVAKTTKDNVETILQAKRDGLTRRAVLGVAARYKTDPDLQRQASADPVRFLDNVTRQVTTEVEGSVGKISDVERALLHDSVAKAVKAEMQDDVLGNAERLRKESDRAEWEVTSDALLDGMTAENVNSTFDVLLSGERSRTPSPQLARINASKAILENITRIQGPDPVASMEARLRALDGLSKNESFVGNPSTVREQIVADYRREVERSYASNVGRVVSQTQVDAIPSLGRPVDPDEAMALWAGDNPNAIGQLLDIVSPASSDPVVTQARDAIAADMTKRISEGMAKLEKAKPKRDESEAEYVKMLNGFVADGNKAYEASAVKSVLSGSPSVNEDTAKRAAWEIALFSRGTMPSKMASDINAGLQSPNPKVRSLSLSMLRSVPPDVQGNLFTNLSRDNAEVGIAAAYTVIASGSGKVADEGGFFEQMRASIRSFPDLMSTPLQYGSRTPSIQAALRPLKDDGRIHMTADDEIDPNSERIYKAMLATTLSSPTATALGNDIDAVAKATYEAMPAWGLKWMRQGNRISLVKDAYGYIPKVGLTNGDTMNDTVREWVLRNPEGVLKALDQDRQRRAEAIAAREGIEVSAALRKTDRPYATGSGGLNPDFVRNLTFSPSLDSGQISMPPDSPFGGLPFSAYYDGRQIDTFVDGSPYSAITIKDYGRFSASLSVPSYDLEDFVIDVAKFGMHPIDETLRALNEAGPRNPRNNP